MAQAQIDTLRYDWCATALPPPLLYLRAAVAAVSVSMDASGRLISDVNRLHIP
jgi:hypothetical protein